ncbi:hypothetical protein C0Q44_08595 [Paenibacillus sp. PCH8]|uniref:hypothetical protein n=1 Tax=Paenibacillus sp. PCH8 TaxID=2066524 RepID=UPI000CF8E431|nr:hypothetical protein [Paenibacillus sp. PCH8]PQP84599.1 hypothetical protein C0Q44_08595 [Paenibacillus sp. PCH8]
MDNLFETTVQRAFKEQFNTYKNKKIILYGTGVVAEFILNNNPSYNIIGLMDGNKKHGELLGKKVYSYEEVLKNKPDIIIVATAKRNIEMIYDRLAYFCHTNNIPLYSVDGRNLFTVYGYQGLSDSQIRYFDVHEELLKSQIEKNEIIYFDIYDVLIMRKTLIKLDVLDIVEYRLTQANIKIPDYINARLKAEQEVMRSHGTINEIYEKLAEISNISVENALEAMAVELEVETSITCSRSSIKAMMRYALDENKKVYLVSDTYFQKEFLESLLLSQGITGYSDLIISNEHKRTKREGLLSFWDNNYSNESSLYIGVDSENEIVQENQSKFNIFLIKSAYDMFLLSSYKDMIYSLNNINERSLFGLIVAKLFNSPFALYNSDGKPKVDSNYNFGYVFIAPLIIKYVFWIIGKMKNEKYDDVLFAARDGWITHRLYSIVREKMRMDIPKGIYFQTSRTLCTLASVKTEEDIRWIAEVPHAYEPEQMLKRRFGLANSEIHEYVEENHVDSVWYAYYHKEAIFLNAKRIRESYLNYIESLNLKSEGNYAFVDFVSSGTCQLLLDNITTFHLEGLYYCKYNNNDESKLNLSGDAMFENMVEQVYCSHSYENYLLLETVMTSLNPSIASMGLDGEFIYGEEVRNGKEMMYVQEVHQAVEDIFLDYIENMHIMNIEINKFVVDSIFSYHQSRYTNEQCEIFDNLRLMEDFGQWHMTLPRAT